MPNNKNNAGSATYFIVILLVLLILFGAYFLNKKINVAAPQQSSSINFDDKADSSTATTNKTKDLDKLPLGDNKYSLTKASKGYILSCVRVGGGGGAFKDGEWIDSNGGTWSKNAKTVIVDGDVKWGNAKFGVSVKDNTRELLGNGLPINHGTGVYPIAKNDDAFNYDRNPNSVKAQSVLKSIPLNPRVASAPSCLNMGPVGYSLNGVAIFNALDGEGRDAAAHEILDKCGGHPERTGEYHYHDYSPCMSSQSSGPILIGYMFDGFGLYKYPINLTNDDLDECHGKVGEVSWNGIKQSIYHYVITDEYPYTIGCFKGI